MLCMGVFMSSKVSSVSFHFGFGDVLVQVFFPVSEQGLCEGYNLVLRSTTLW